MRTTSVAGFLALLLLTVLRPVKADLVHPGISVTREELDTIKARVQNGIQPQLQGFNKLKDDWRSGLGYSPHPVPFVDVGWMNNPRTNYDEVLNDATAANGQALLWYITGNEQYAKNVMAILEAQADNLQEIRNNNQELYAGWTGKGYAKAAELLKHTYAGWTNELEQKVVAFFDRVYLPMVNPRNAQSFGGNWFTIMYDTYMCIAIFKNDEEAFRQAAKGIEHSIEWYLYPNGECGETGRDLQHVQMGISAIARAAETAWKQGIDIFSHMENRLLTGYEFQAKYVLMGGSPTCTDCGLYPAFGRGEHTETNKTLDLLGMPNEGSRGAGWEIIYNHYHNRKGMEAPQTKRMVDDIRNRNWVGWTGKIAGMGTLLHGDMHHFKQATPFVRFTSPVRKFDEPETYTWRQTGDTLTLKARASDYLGEVASVEFYANGNRIGQASSTPWEYTWFDVPAGNHELTAVVTDRDGTTQIDSTAVKVSTNPADILLDAVYPGQAVITGEWLGVSRPEHLKHFGYNYLHDRNSGSDPDKSVAFTPTIAVPGQYHVYLSWKYRSDAPVAAPIEVKHAEGTDNSVTVNQQQTNEWNYIGTYRFDKGAGQYIKIIASDAGLTMADACKLVYVRDAEVVFSANCGSDQDFTGHEGTVYKADSHQSGGETFFSDDPVQRTNDKALYQTFRFSHTSFSYDIPIDNGYYEVTLKFSEDDWIWPGQRTCRISAEGETIRDNLDIAQEMVDIQITDFGAYKAKAFDLTFAVSVKDGELNLGFEALKGRAIVNGILVTTLDEAPISVARPSVKHIGTAYQPAAHSVLRVFSAAGRETIAATQSCDGLYRLIKPLAPGTYVFTLRNNTGNDSALSGIFHMGHRTQVLSSKDLFKGPLAR